MAEHSVEKAYLVGVKIRGSRPLLSVNDSLAELALLADTAGMLVVGRAEQTVQQIHSKTFIGSGKVVEIQQALTAVDGNVVIFDDELSPRHQRELEKCFGETIKVLDRSALILDIFAQHANTREGTLQVELAQYEYRLPRLTRQWTHLARQAGGSGMRTGVGLRGPGETQLEVDRREIGRKIVKLRQDLDLVREQRSQRRARRARAGIPVIALVGYTNAGKSTLLNTLTGAKSYVADQLFATLDPMTRRIDLPTGKQALITDTVGFIQKLPTSLVAAFRATLEEVAEAGLLLHLVDASHPNVLQHIEAVEDTLAEIDVPAVPRILVWNKTDLLPGTPQQSLDLSTIGNTYKAQVYISAQKKTGIPDLLTSIENTLMMQMTATKLLIPYSQGELVSLLFNSAYVVSHVYTSAGMEITAQIPEFLYHRFVDYQLSG